MSSSLMRLTAANISKDLRLEWRSRDVFNSMLFFAVLVVVIFSFAFEPTAEESRRLAGGLFWVAFLFSTVVALNQAWARSEERRVGKECGARRGGGEGVRKGGRDGRRGGLDTGAASDAECKC